MAARQDAPAKVHIELYESPFSGLRFFPDFLVIYGLRGKTLITEGSERYTLEKGGLLTITQFRKHEIRCEDGAGVSVLHIPQEVLYLIDENELLLRVHCYVRSSEPGSRQEYDHLRTNYAHVFQNFFQTAPHSDILVLSYTSSLLGLLTKHFCSAGKTSPAGNNTDVLERCSRIIQYIHGHWQEEISIESIADAEYVSSGYLSRFFRKNLGMTFTDYITDLRLLHAVRDLENSSETVTQIALANGFKNTNSFIHYFREKFGMTPGQYRRQHQREDAFIRKPGKRLPDESGVPELLEYASAEAPAASLPSIPSENRLVTIDASKKGRPLRHTWRRVLNFGYAKEGLLAEVQTQIRKAQKEIGFEFVHFHGILDDDMHVYFENEKGQPYLDFSRIDLLLDSLLSIGLKPYIEFSYMPRLLARKPTETFDRSVNISAFRSKENWSALIRGFLQHCLVRYGRATVRGWRFTTIDINSVIAGFLSMEEYLTLYRTTWQCVKEADPAFLFGGPGGFIFNVTSGNTIRLFLSYAKGHACLPDFICTQCFPHRKIDLQDDFWRYTMTQSSSPAVLSTDPDFMKHALNAYRKLLADNGLETLAIWIEQWNSTIWQRDLSGDTCYKAAYLAKNICENYDEVESAGYWSFSDFMEEISDFGSVYHGGYGLFTYNGIPKSGWQSLRLLHMLGDRKLASGEGWFAAGGQNSIQILLYHYCHYDYLYCRRYRRLTDPRHAYSVFAESGPLRYRIEIRGLQSGTYEMRKYTLSPEHGSSFDVWVRMGMPPYLSDEEREYLEQMSRPLYQVETLGISEDFSIESQLNPHSVQLLTLSMSDI